MTTAVSARYRDAAGASHEIVVHETAEGAWEILDTTSRASRVVDTLSGCDDGRPQAEAVARDYAQSRQHR